MIHNWLKTEFFYRPPTLPIPTPNQDLKILCSVVLKVHFKVHIHKILYDTFYLTLKNPNVRKEPGRQTLNTGTSIRTEIFDVSWTSIFKVLIEVELTICHFDLSYP